MFMFHTTQNHFFVDLMPSLEDHQCSIWKTSVVEWKRALNLNQRCTGNLWLAHFLVAGTLMSLWDQPLIFSAYVILVYSLLVVLKSALCCAQ